LPRQSFKQLAACHHPLRQINDRSESHSNSTCYTFTRSEVRAGRCASKGDGPGAAKRSLCLCIFVAIEHFSENNLAGLANFQIAIGKPNCGVGGGYPRYGRHDEAQLSIGSAAAGDDDYPRMLLRALCQSPEIPAVDRHNGARLIQREPPELMVGSAQETSVSHMNGIYLAFPQSPDEARRCVLIEEKNRQQDQSPRAGVAGLRSGAPYNKAAQIRHRLRAGMGSPR